MIEEFVKALGERRTYWNAWTLFGFLWGLPIPFFSITLQMFIGADARAVVQAWPLHLVFALHPFLFGVLFGAMGTMNRWKTEALSEAMRRLERTADTDALTGLSNHRYIRRRLAEEVERARRTGEALSIALLDLDNFKPVNDRLGHLAGDEVLREAARRLDITRREYDIVGRYGGDEFVFIFPKTERAGALAVATRALAEIGGKPFHLLGATEDVVLTASIGVASFDGRGQSVDSLLMNADQAMYLAKARGRNCIAITEGVVREGEPAAAVPRRRNGDA